MRVLLQRVRTASVEAGGEQVAKIGPGLLLLVGFGEADRGDWQSKIGRAAEKLVNLRIFADGEGRMNRSLADVGGEVLAVSQFTLYGDARKGRRPSFVRAARPGIAIPLYEGFVAELEKRLPGRVRCGRFGAEMKVALVNDGPVTLVVERQGDAAS